MTTASGASAIPSYNNSDIQGGFSGGYDVSGRCMQFQSYMEPQYYSENVSPGEAKPTMSWSTSAYQEDPEAIRKDGDVSNGLHPVISIMPLASSPDCVSQSSCKADLISPDRRTDQEFSWQRHSAEPANKKRRLENDVCPVTSAHGRVQVHSSPEQTVPDKQHVTEASPAQNLRGIYLPPTAPTYSSSSVIQNEAYSTNPYAIGGYPGFSHPVSKEQQCLPSVGSTYWARDQSNPRFKNKRLNPRSLIGQIRSGLIGFYVFVFYYFVFSIGESVLSRFVDSSVFSCCEVLLFVLECCIIGFSVEMVPVT